MVWWPKGGTEALPGGLWGQGCNRREHWEAERMNEEETSQQWVNYGCALRCCKACGGLRNCPMLDGLKYVYRSVLVKMTGPQTEGQGGVSIIIPIGGAIWVAVPTINPNAGPMFFNGFMSWLKNPGYFKRMKFVSVVATMSEGGQMDRSPGTSLASSWQRRGDQLRKITECGKRFFLTRKGGHLQSITEWPMAVIRAAGSVEKNGHNNAVCF